MKIAFCDFWTGFKANSNFFSELLLLNFEGIRVVHPRKADVIFHSVFGQSHKKYSALKVLYTGENLSYKNYDSDFAFSFDITTDDHKNFRLPLWMLQLKWFRKTNYGNPNLVFDINKLMNPQSDKIIRPIFLAGIFNHDVSENRMHTMGKLMNMGKTNFYGAPFGNSFKGQERSKIKLLKKVKFNLCFENDNTFGYHTEKLIHAKIAGCIPIYWANSDSVGSDFNIKSFLFISDPYDSEKFKELEDQMNSKKFLEDLQVQPLFNTVPQLDGVVHYLTRIIKSA